ncbi:MAG: YajQ family cyclic di-GMP-binding protein [Candidatus Krumholzibacteria bacterium]|nr:YajQ family cyclic di-GMP-binding protein [Candidatus Krumholzibacteria bacterium]
MPSFDVVSRVDMHEVTNAIDQANREVTNRFDFKGTDSRFERQESTITLHASSKFQLKQMLDVLEGKLAKRHVDLGCLLVGEAEESGKGARQTVTIRQGIETDLARQIIKRIKETKLKVQASIQGEKVRISGKKKDDLQQVIALLKEQEWDMPLQFENFRD